MIRRSLIPVSLFLLGACASGAHAPSAHARQSVPPATSSASSSPSAASPALPETSVEAVRDPAQYAGPVLSLAEKRAAFVRDAAERYGIDPARIERVLAQAAKRDDVIALMSRPAERVVPWNEYRERMLTRSRIDQGRAFLDKHRQALAREEARYGVPAEIITAIVGVETSYGGYTGKHRVVDALYTLGFFYPRSGDPARAAYEEKRERFFRDELAQLFALAREENLDILGLTGSYAGAMGMAQFMPSSYREYAVDGDGDGRRDLFGSTDDVFASIANYFIRKGGERGGWLPGGAVAVQAELRAGFEEFNPDDWLPTYSLDELSARGYRALEPAPAGAAATPVGLQVADGRQYWLGFRNFYAITRYNNSKMYAMAVYQLSQAIAGKPLPPA